MATTTLLSLTRAGFELSDYAARGVKMDMAPIDAAANTRRDINGNKVNLAREQFKKYKFTVSCQDQESPSFAADSSAEIPVWPGDTFTLVCIPQLGAAEQQTFTVMVVSPGWQVQTDEYGADVGWTLNLEQV